MLQEFEYNETWISRIKDRDEKCAYQRNQGRGEHKRAG